MESTMNMDINTQINNLLTAGPAVTGRVAYYTAKLVTSPCLLTIWVHGLLERLVQPGISE